MVKATIHVKCSRNECQFEGDVTLQDDENLANSKCKACGYHGTMKPHDGNFKGTRNN